MYLLQVFLLACSLTSVNTLCHDTSWSLTSTEQSTCENIDQFIRGFQISNFVGKLDGAECCTAPSQWSNKEPQVVYTNWTQDLNSKFGWAHCPTGFFLQGLYKSEGVSLNSFNGGRCTKPSSHPFYYGDCYHEDISMCLDTRSKCSCREGYFVTGLRNTSCDGLYCLDSLRCCAMAAKPSIIGDLPQLKARIMDTTLWNMANLASMLGYSWSWGCNGKNVGEDFYRDEDNWIANSNGNCKGEGGDNRLRLAFRDWGFEVKDIVYGNSVKEKLDDASLDTGRIYNNDKKKVIEAIEITENIQETLTHTATGTWKHDVDIKINLPFNLPLYSVGSIRATFERSFAASRETKILLSKTLSKRSSKTIAPFSAAKYAVSVSRVKTTIPYTATIITRFATNFTGLLKWEGGYNSSNTNYHNLYRAQKQQHIFNYSFGDSSVPFYEALKQESESQSMPWFWSEMISQHPKAKYIIERLTDESQYAFYLEGNLELVSGANIDVIWDSVTDFPKTLKMAPKETKRVKPPYSAPQPTR